MLPLPLAFSRSRDVCGILQLQQEGAVEVGGIVIEIGEGLKDLGIGAIDGGQGRTIDGSRTVGRFDSDDVSRCGSA